MEVVTVGHASLDRVKINERESIQLGGAAVYSAMAAKIFSRTGIVSRVGRDFSVEHYSELEEAGIDTFGLKKVKGSSSSFSIEYDKEGNASYTSYERNVGVQIRPSDIPRNYMKASGFHIAPMAASKQQAFLKFLKKNTNAVISLNTHVGYFSKYRKGIDRLMPLADVFILNGEEAMRLAGTKNLERALNFLKRRKHNLIVVTIGVHGSAVIQEGGLTFFPSLYQPNIIDLTGCGDAFAGAFISTYITTKDALKSANIANSVASISATDWNFQALKALRFKTLENFQQYVIARQRRLGKKQKSIEFFF